VQRLVAADVIPSIAMQLMRLQSEPGAPAAANAALRSLAVLCCIAMTPLGVAALLTPVEKLRGEEAGLDIAVVDILYAIITRKFSLHKGPEAAQISQLATDTIRAIVLVASGVASLDDVVSASFALGWAGLSSVVAAYNAAVAAASTAGPPLADPLIGCVRLEPRVFDFATIVAELRAGEARE
jgi:hypothetical protein